MNEPTQPPFDQFKHFAGFDWASDKHHIVIVDGSGNTVLSLCISDDAQGWAALRERIQNLPGLAVAVETNCGPAVERLLEMGLAVYPLNPKVAERYRDRKSPAGVKSDERDAFSFADALRTDGHGWRRLRPQDPLTAELRLLCRDEIGLIEQRTALVNQLRAALHEYYPAVLEAFEDWVSKPAWEFVIAFPTPQSLVIAGKRRWQSFLHAHKLYRPQTADKRLEIFSRATAFASPSAAVTSAKSLLAVTLAKQLRLLESQLSEYRARITRLFNDHPDKDCFGSLPGAGEKLAPRLQQTSPPHRAPLGRQEPSMVRRADAYYQQKKSQGLTHAAALRCLGQRWLKILWKMWQTGKAYDEALHTRNQIKHGSWVIQLTSSATA